MIRSPWGHFFTSPKWHGCWALGARAGGQGNELLWHHRTGCWYKSQGSWLFKGCGTSCPGSAADSSLAGWQAKPLQLFSAILCLWWNPVMGKMCPEEVLGLGALFHISRPLWARWGPLLFSLTPPAQSSGWPKARMALASPLLRKPSHRESASVT